MLAGFFVFQGKERMVPCKD